MRDTTHEQSTRRNDGPLVSAVICTYRRAHLVTRAIKSVQEQSYKNIEIIVVDDASPDNTREVISQINDSRIRYIRHQTNKGLPAARNTGIREAKGEYIAFLDDDDEWLPDKTAKQLNLTARFDAVVGMGLIDGKILSSRHGEEAVGLDALRRGNKWGSCTLLARADVMRDVMFDESLRVGEDWDAFIRIAQKYRIGHVDEPLFIYHQTEATGSRACERMLGEARTEVGSRLEERAVMLKKHREFFGEKWYRYHLAAVLLAYIGTRPSKVSAVRYAAQRCGVAAVIAVIAFRIGWHIRNLTWGRHWHWRAE
jgi:glycosyltransferase involved in cell wall biosynthesis